MRALTAGLAVLGVALIVTTATALAGDTTKVCASSRWTRVRPSRRRSSSPSTARRRRRCSNPPPSPPSTTTASGRSASSTSASAGWTWRSWSTPRRTCPWRRWPSSKQRPSSCSATCRERASSVCTRAPPRCSTPRLPIHRRTSRTLPGCARRVTARFAAGLLGALEQFHRGSGDAPGAHRDEHRQRRLELIARRSRPRHGHRRPGRAGDLAGNGGDDPVDRRRSDASRPVPDPRRRRRSGGGGGRSRGDCAPGSVPGDHRHDRCGWAGPTSSGGEQRRARGPPRRGGRSSPASLPPRHPCRPTRTSSDHCRRRPDRSCRRPPPRPRRVLGGASHDHTTGTTARREHRARRKEQRRHVVGAGHLRGRRRRNDRHGGGEQRFDHRRSRPPASPHRIEHRTQSEQPEGEE